METKSLAMGGILAAMIAGSAQAATFGMNETALTLGDDGSSLVVIAGVGAGTELDLKDPSGKSVEIDDIDWRPKTGELYGYSEKADTVYLIDRATGKTTPVATLPKGSTGDVGFDFNNAIDRARVVSSHDDNLVFNPDAGTLTAFTDLFYGVGDKNEKKNPTVSMNAYTNAFAGATTTLQYVIDTGLNVLATLNNNTGILSTVGALYLDGKAFDPTDAGGFDILSPQEGQNMALALLTTMFKGDRTQAIYQIDLTANASGQINLTRLVDVTKKRDSYDGFAVIPTPSAVPLPASVLLLGGAVAGLGALRLRRKAAKTAA